MNRSKNMIAGAVITAMTLSIFAPAASLASQKTKNEWRNLTGASAAVGVLGLATHNKTMAAAGLAGAAYSGYRYEQDRKHQSQARAARHREMERRLAEKRRHEMLMRRNAQIHHEAMMRRAAIMHHKTVMHAAAMPPAPAPHHP